MGNSDNGFAAISGIYARETAAFSSAEMERVIVTGSNIPSAEEVGPNPVDTYRPADIEKLGIRNATDLLANLPRRWARPSTRILVSGGGDGAVIPNLRGLLPKETLVLIDGKRVAIDGFGGLPMSPAPAPLAWTSISFPSR